MSKRNFNEWLSTFRESISTYKFYVNFEKVHRHVEEIKIELNILNSLIASTDIEKDFVKIIDDYPKVLKCIPILLAVRQKEIKISDFGVGKDFNFLERNLPTEDYVHFMRETGLFDLLENRIISNLVDYVTGVETGLDTNGRKNRGGTLMEDLLEIHFQQKGYDYYREMYATTVMEKWGIDLSEALNKGKTKKRFDFIIKTQKNIYLIEANFYSSSGSKLNETARSYKLISKEISEIQGVSFIWITDGYGWKSAKRNLEETFDSMETIYNLNDIDSGLFDELIT